MKVHFLYWRINFTIFWRCKVTYYNILIITDFHAQPLIAVGSYLV